MQNPAKICLKVMHFPSKFSCTY